MKIIVNSGGGGVPQDVKNLVLLSKHSPEEMCSAGQIPVNRKIVADALENKPSGYSSLSYFWRGIGQERDNYIWSYEN
jgi:hypothetical protein